MIRLRAAAEFVCLSKRVLLEVGSMARLLLMFRLKGFVLACRSFTLLGFWGRPEGLVKLSEVILEPKRRVHRVRFFRS